MKYKRILLKLSGEALMGKSKTNSLDPEVLEQYSMEIKGVHESGVELAIVIGGGNIFRGGQAEALGIDRVQGDYMGMLATVMNAIASAGDFTYRADRNKVLIKSSDSPNEREVELTPTTAVRPGDTIRIRERFF